MPSCQELVMLYFLARQFHMYLATFSQEQFIFKYCNPSSYCLMTSKVARESTLIRVALHFALRTDICDQSKGQGM